MTVLYNLVNEPWLKYSMSAVADRGLKSSHYTSARLRDEVLYLETSTCVRCVCACCVRCVCCGSGDARACA